MTSNIKKYMLVFLVSTALWSVSVLGDAKEMRSNSINSDSVSVGGDFTLTDHHGEVFELKQLRGKLVLIFFGYTFCPDICPTELSSLASVLRSLGGDADKVSALFISIDPERDTPAKLKQYVPYYSPLLLGLTGTMDEVNKVADAYHVQRKIHQHVASDQYYSADHSANLYVIGSDGKVLHIIPFGLPAEHIQQVLRAEIKKLDLSH